VIEEETGQLPESRASRFAGSTTRCHPLVWFGLGWVGSSALEAIHPFHPDRFSPCTSHVNSSSLHLPALGRLRRPHFALLGIACPRRGPCCKATRNYSNSPTTDSALAARPPTCHSPTLNVCTYYLSPPPSGSPPA
jgi:hypothetical protein